MNLEVIKDITNQAIKDKEIFLVDIKLSKSNVIEIFVDSLQGVNLQTCIEINKFMEEHLDREEEDYELTVASAGIGYPFKVEGQYIKCKNKDVEIIFTNNTKQIATLKDFSQESISVEWTEKQKLEGKKRKEDVLIEKTINKDEIKEIREYIKF